MSLKKVFALLLFLRLAEGNCSEMTCPVCCQDLADGNAICTADQLSCKVRPSISSFSLFGGLWVFGLMIFGVPFTMLLTELLCLKRFHFTGMTLCEMLMVGVTWCLNSRRGRVVPVATPSELGRGHSDADSFQPDVDLKIV